MIPSQALKNPTADEVVFRRGNLTYQQIHAYGWRNEEECRRYVFGRWGMDTGKRGITIRTRKLWTAARSALYVSNSSDIEGSLWRVSYFISEALKSEEIPKCGGTHFNKHTFESSITMGTLGYVIAPDETRARMAAMVTLGPRAHSPNTTLSREGVGDWERAKELNRELRESYLKAIEQAKLTLKQKLWEIEQAECQVNFLEVGATFDSVPFAEAG
jgi:hypothetical protein